MQSVGRKVNMMEQVFEVPSQDVITKDNAVVKVDGVVFFQVLDAAKAAYEVSNLDQAMIALVQTNIRTVIGSMDLDESLSQRETINAKLLGVVDHATSPWGVKVNRIEIKDIQPPRDLIESMAAADEGRTRQARLDPGSRRRAPVGDPARRRREAGAILEAEGKREAAYREAEARERLAEAEAKATQMVSPRRSPKGDVQAINYFVAQKYVEAFKELAMASQPEVRADADGNQRHDRLHRRHRRTGQGAEAMAPGAFMLWFGFAAVAVFLAVLLLPLEVPLLAQVAAFIALSFVSIQVYRKWFGSRERQSDQPALNRRTAALIGRVVLLDRAIVDGRGRVQIADAYWEVTGPELPEGARVRIIGGDAMTLQVEAG
jgi:regulator of protease activity HflC (stomatin/prohibitin superfamily)/membrane protein implicated in regulation of membrane protease activity